MMQKNESEDDIRKWKRASYSVIVWQRGIEHGGTGH